MTNTKQMREARPPELPEPNRFWPSMPLDGHVYSKAQADEIRWACFEAGVQAAPAPALDAWAEAANWLRNNYQYHPNIASLCDAIREFGAKGPQ